MKVINNLNMDMKEEIEKMTDEVSRLKLFKEDHDDILKKQQIDIQKQFKKEIDILKMERNQYKLDLDNYKTEFQEKINQVRLMENELEDNLVTNDQPEIHKSE